MRQIEKQLSMLVCLCAASTMIFALNCKNLGITMTNNTNSDCVLTSQSFFSGFPSSGTIPTFIPSGTMSSIFYMQEGYDGIDVQLDYRCGTRTAIIESKQEACMLVAGMVTGLTYVGNSVLANYSSTDGSWWSNQPGHISWTFH